MSKSNFSYNLETDVQRFGCYMTAHLPREHPLVSDTTNSDRALEGAFLGWDPATPLAWMWSFKHRRPMRLSDPIFSNHLLPFRDPECIVNLGDLTDKQVVQMHQQDIAEAATSTGNTTDIEDFMSQQPTQPTLQPHTSTGELVETRTDSHAAAPTVTQPWMGEASESVTPPNPTIPTTKDYK